MNGAGRPALRPAPGGCEPGAAAAEGLTPAGGPVAAAPGAQAGDLSESIEKSVKQAEETCEDGSTAECAAAWDEVEELSAEAAHKKAKEVKKDPMEEFCKDNEDADGECPFVAGGGRRGRGGGQGRD